MPLVSTTRNKSHKLTHVKLDMGQFDPSLLREDVALEAALSSVQGHLLNPAVDQSALVSLLLDTPNLFQFIVSSSAEWTSDLLISGILDSFPSEARLFHTSLSSKLLSALSYFFLSLDMPLANVGECHRAIQLARPVLDAISSLRFGDQNNAQYYLQSLRRAELSAVIRTAYLGGSETEDTDLDNHTATANADVNIPIAAAIDVSPTAFPFIQPMKAALYFESVEGFGEWRILISTRADRNIREAKKKDSKLFRIIMKKIRELSNGHFSDDNQKRLTGSDIDIPIFEAKMTRDTRFGLDCVKEFDIEIERQGLLRIYGIYTHAQLDRRFWDAVGQHLAGKGREYRKRCVYRRAPHHPGDNVYLPQSFPQADLESPVVPSRIPDLRNEDREELHALLVLEKFITFSQALLNSILADQDVAHVFHLSPAEQEIVKHSGSCYVLGRSGTGKTTTMLFKMLGIERSWDLMNDSTKEKIPRPRQVFVTQSRVLAEKVEEYYAKLSKSCAAAQRTAEDSAKMASVSQDSEDDGLLDRDEEELWSGNLPKRFSELKQEHFPLFLTFDQLCRLLEADLFSTRNHSLSLGGVDADDGTLANEYMSQRRDSFVSYDVFIQSYWPHFPQGLKKNLDPASVFAEFMGVIKGSEKTLNIEDGFLDKHSYTNLSHRQQGTFANRREAVYALFESYMKHMRERRDWDAPDRTHTILLGLKESGVPGKKMDFIYVDEAQDNLLIDALGIVSCAHSVVQLITRFWPHAIDTLAEEKGIIDGFKPVFLSSWDQDTVQYEQFLFGSSGTQLEFGAQQCILVRDDIAREKLRAQVGDIGLVLTLYESKGLEFNDVLLYNFFEDSTVDISQWRIVLNALPEKDYVKCPRFDDARHNGVCRELKFLYVAITRARKNLWLADCSDRAEAIRALWTAQGLVQVCTTSDTLPRLAVSSTPEEWAKTARDLFDHRRYLQAARCYERALLNRERDIAHAFYLREQARGTSSTGRIANTVRITAFVAAANAFSASAVAAAKRSEKIAYHRNAAECFVEAADDVRAAEAFLHAELFTRAAQHYRKAGMFDNAVEVIQSHRTSIQDDDAENIIAVAKMHYFKHQALERATNLFSSLDDALEFMDDYGFDTARATLLEGIGRIAEAAELHLAEGRTIIAIRLFIQDSQNAASKQRAEECLLEGLWKHLSFSLVPRPGLDISDSPLGELLTLSNQMRDAGGSLSMKAQDEVLMFQNIASGQLLRLQGLGEKFHNSHQDSAATVLCLDHAFSKPLKTHIMSHFELASFLQTFALYTGELKKIVLDADPSHSTSLQRLFGFEILEDSKDNVAIGSGTFLHDFVSQRRRMAPDLNGRYILARLCLTLLGYNIPSFRVRLDIQHAITSLFKPDKPYPRQLLRFVRASSWDDLVRALRYSSVEDNSRFDELIQLKDTTRLSGPVRPLTDPGRGPFVPAQTETYGEAAIALPSHDGSDTIYNVLPLEDLGDNDGDNSTHEPSADNLDETAPQEDVDIDHEMDADTAALSIDAGQEPQAPVPPTEREVEAARRIARFYRQVIVRDRRLPKKGPAEARMRWFVICRDGLTQEMCKGKYRYRYLGPLPHALVCLEGINTYVAVMKKKARLRLLSESTPHAEYETLNAQIARAISATKETVRLRKILDPKSDFHRKKSLDELEVKVKEIEQIMSTLPTGATKEWEWDLKVAIKGTFQAREPATKPPKPELVVDIEEW
ncbi:hypothetical protein EW026_g5704 [Hermanssonia centrifuga]|uniref:UvrD-like helicase C-terminal domain-containing protein n=1 Tax=Hermanssonia centrifuga TaxID=98765 RepID=A0A4V3X9Z2_9APHY|nr:hypothetical protein EW026_g5704 [Hermanssonia centrifuga]